MVYVLTLLWRHAMGFYVLFKNLTWEDGNGIYLRADLPKDNVK